MLLELTLIVFWYSSDFRFRGLEPVAFLYGCTAVAGRVRLGNLEAQPLKSTLPVSP